MDPKKNPDAEVEPATVVEDPKGNDEPKDPLKKEPSQDEPKDPKDPKDGKQFSKRERLIHAKEKIESQLSELDDDEDDDKPLTRGDLKRMEREKSRDTAIDLASAIDDEDERTQVIDLLENRITPSGNPTEDLTLARAAVNAIKTAQIAEDAARKQNPNQHGSNPGGPGKVEDVFTPTEDEKVFMRAPYNLTQEDIIKARRRSQAQGE
jgi:hypothetical protein